MTENNPAPERVTLQIGDRTVELPLIVGSEGERAIDIAQLRWSSTSSTLLEHRGYRSVIRRQGRSFGARRHKQ